MDTISNIDGKDDNDDHKGDDNKNSADPSKIDDLGDEIGTRVGKHEEDPSKQV